MHANSEPSMFPQKKKILADGKFAPFQFLLKLGSHKTLHDSLCKWISEIKNC